MLVDYKIHFIYNKNSNMLTWWRRKRDLILINFKVNKKNKKTLYLKTYRHGQVQTVSEKALMSVNRCTLGHALPYTI